MKRLLLLWITRRWIKRAQHHFGSTQDGKFNTAGFQHAIYETTGILPHHRVAWFLLFWIGAEQLSGGAHWQYK